MTQSVLNLIKQNLDFLVSQFRVDWDEESHCFIASLKDSDLIGCGTTEAEAVLHLKNHLLDELDTPRKSSSETRSYDVSLKIAIQLELLEKKLNLKQHKIIEKAVELYCKLHVEFHGHTKPENTKLNLIAEIIQIASQSGIERDCFVGALKFATALPEYLRDSSLISDGTSFSFSWMKKEDFFAVEISNPTYFSYRGHIGNLKIIKTVEPIKSEIPEVVIQHIKSVSQFGESDATERNN